MRGEIASIDSYTKYSLSNDYKKFFLSWLAAAVGTFVFNGLFHGLLAADFFDRNNAALGSAAGYCSGWAPMGQL